MDERPTRNVAVSRDTSEPALTADLRGGFANATSQQLRQMMQQKEKELQQINEMRFRSMEDELKTKDQQIAHEKSKFQKLRQDFEYNLKLLEERDEELERYDKTFADLRQLLQEKESALSDCKIMLADAQTKIKHEQSRIVEIESYYQTKLMESKDLILQARWQSEQEVAVQREDIESQRRKLVLQLREKEAEIDAIRRESSLNYDQSLKQLQERHQKTADELLTLVQSHENQIKNQSKTIEFLTIEKNGIATKSHELELALKDMEKRFKSTSWELEDTTRSKDLRIKELEMGLKKVEESKSLMITEFEEKMNELMSNLHTVEQEYSADNEEKQRQFHQAAAEKDSHFREITTNFQNRIELMNDTCEKLKRELEDEKASHKRTKWEYEDQLRRKDTDHLQEISLQKIAAEKIQNELSAAELEVRNREKDIASLKEKIASAKKALDEKRGDLESTKISLQRQIEKEQEAKQKIIDENWSLKNEIERKEREVSSLQESLKVLDLQTAATEKLLREAKKQNEELTALIEKSEEQCHQLEQELQRTDAELVQWRQQSERPQSAQITRLQRAALNQGVPSVRLDTPNTPFSVALPEMSPLPSPSALLPPTPVFSQGSKPATPLEAIHSNFDAITTSAHMNILKKENEDLKQYCQKLQDENQKVRSVIVEMRLEMENLQKITNPEQDKRLQMEIDSLKRDGDSKLREIFQLKAEIRNLQEQTQFSNRSVDELAREKMLLTERIKTFEAQYDLVIKENRVLRSKIHEAAKDLIRLTSEKEALIELSNSLRADLRALNTVKDEEAMENQEYQKFNSRLQSVEYSLRETQKRNAKLKNELELRDEYRSSDHVPSRLESGSTRTSCEPDRETHASKSITHTAHFVHSPRDTEPDKSTTKVDSRKARGNTDGAAATRAQLQRPR